MATDQAYFCIGSVASNRVLLSPLHIQYLRDAIAVAQRVAFCEAAVNRTAYALSLADELAESGSTWTTASDFTPHADLDSELVARLHAANDPLSVSFYIDVNHALGEAGVFAHQPDTIGLDWGVGDCFSQINHGGEVR